MVGYSYILQWVSLLN